MHSNEVKPTRNRAKGCYNDVIIGNRFCEGLLFDFRNISYMYDINVNHDVLCYVFSFASNYYLQA